MDCYSADKTNSVFINMLKYKPYQTIKPRRAAAGTVFGALIITSTNV